MDKEIENQDLIINEEDELDEWEYTGVQLANGGISVVENKRSRDDMIKDVSHTLAASGLTPKAKRDLFETVARDWTKDLGKYKGCQFWSKEAITLYTNMVVSNNGKSIPEKNYQIYLFMSM
ncbi:hypothetical protein GA0061096_4425 [Fictibacillus enclensis]|uniref:Uncharacterized protein n=1 Tax=Fictibacillus enclensis TaxID=1017270 RepID=A0A0V8IYC6_9BACL|nr:hypothetical protein [Fictibacillus enclensis]KSU79750.1 hypothetical protein AS030_21090 [Fictibacillus enclensis]SCC39427.1 hypothetical protein GA0061096_4425 [Fictibacillus enclensis]